MFFTRNRALKLGFASALFAPFCAFAQTATAAATSAATAVEAVAPAAAAAATAVATGSAGAASAKVAAANPYGIGALITHGDWVTWFILGTLVIMSLASWYVIVVKLVEQSKIYRQANAVKTTFWAGNSLRQSTDALAKDSAFRYIAEQGLAGAGKQEGLLGTVDTNTWISQSIQRAIAAVQSQLQGGLAVLATVGSTAPFVGLFGTVWGILNALVAIGISGQASIDKVAGPVGEALYMTAIGLAVAVPAVLGYNWLVRRNKLATETIQAFGSDLHAVLQATVKK